MSRIITKQKLTLYIAVLFFSTAIPFYAQNDKVKILISDIETYIDLEQYDQALSTISNIDVSDYTVYEVAQLQYFAGKIYEIKNQDNFAYDFYMKSREKYEQIDSINKVQELNRSIYALLIATENFLVDPKPYLDEYLEYANASENPSLISTAYKELATSLLSKDPKQAIKYIKEAIQEIEKTPDTLIGKAKLLSNLGVFYADPRLQYTDSALTTYAEAERLLKQTSGNDANNLLVNITINKGVAILNAGKLKEALPYFLEAEEMPITKYEDKTRLIIYYYTYLVYKNIDDLENALIYFEKYSETESELNQQAQESAIKEINTKYKVKERELENENLKSELKLNRTIIGIAIGIIVIVVVIAVLITLYLKKKRTIAEQETLIEQQRMEKMLKDQELNQIDLMLESQEKERQLIANELHDSLGSLLTTLKFNFESLETQTHATENATQLFHKTRSLIDETYNEVRNISHLKNVGVATNTGLLPAVNTMAEKIQLVNRLEVNVIHHGLTKRLENIKEIAVFRIIQELITNCLKHAKANAINIYLTQHGDDELNIMIEDDGIGFDPKMVKTKDGIGLKSIEQKVEAMDGSFTIDSAPNNGTTIIIELPL